MAVAKLQTRSAEPPATRPKRLRLRMGVQHPRFAEFSLVRALKDIRERSQVVPAGSIGTVVDVVRGGEGYLVEFTLPSPVVVSARPNELSSA